MAAKRVLVGMTVVMALAGATAGQTTAPSPAPTRGDLLAVNSLLHSVDELRVLSAAPARARRLVSHLQFAKALMSDHPLVNYALANVVYSSQQLAAPAAEATALYLKAYGDDYAQWRLWLDWSLSRKQTASDRIAWLDSVVGRTELPIRLRAEAAALKISVLLGGGLNDQALTAVEAALKLDPHNVRALMSKLSMSPEPQGLQRVSLLLSLAAATGGDSDVTLSLASMLQSMGLHSEALAFHEHVWAMTLRGKTEPQTLHAAAVRYANALLDAGEAQRAIDQCAPLLEQFHESVDLRSLLAEAFDNVGRPGKAITQRAAIAGIYQPIMTAMIISSDQARQLAMFFTITKPDWEKALRYARQAAADGQANEITERIVGAAELASDKQDIVQAGLTRLEKLVDKDMYAAALLADYYARVGKKADASRVIMRGADISREGPAYRRLASVAANQKIQIAAAAGAEAARDMVRAFDKRTVTMSAEPEKYISITIRPVRDSVAPGEPIEVEISLRNISQITVPIGPGGLLRPSVALTVAVEQISEKFDDFPVATLPAPRYLLPGQTVTRVVRLDAGRLSVELARGPLDKLTLTVTAIAAPYQYGNNVLSAVDGVEIPTISIARRDILPQFDRSDASRWPAMYRRMLGLIVRDMKQGNLEQRVRAARQVGSLLALVRQVELARAKLPRELHKDVAKPALLTMLREILKDPSDVVRTEMLMALNYVPVDGDIMTLLGSAMTDPSELVRYRLVEMLAANEVPGRDNLVKYFSKDNSPAVRRMAAAFAPYSGDDR